MKWIVSLFLMVLIVFVLLPSTSKDDQEFSKMEAFRDYLKKNKYYLMYSDCSFEWNRKKLSLLAEYNEMEYLRILFDSKYEGQPPQLILTDPIVLNEELLSDNIIEKYTEKASEFTRLSSLWGIIKVEGDIGKSGDITFYMTNEKYQVVCNIEGDKCKIITFN